MTVAAEALTRATLARPAAPVRIVHVGLGAFHRAHQAWYTAHAADADQWGIASFSGRGGPASDALVDALQAQAGLYTLIMRGSAGDDVEVVDSIVEVHRGGESAALVDLMASDMVAIVSTTVTEAGYRLTADGDPDSSDPVVAADLAELAAGGIAVRSTLALIAHGLEERRRRGAGPLTIMPCDNMPANGEFVRRGLLGFAAAIGGALPAWIEDNVTFVSTSVDRITPRRDDADLLTAREHGFDDAAPVVTEPFSSWVISGRFKAGRPRWETAGAEFVDDLAPYEHRKLWLLNGAHSALANHGRLLGHSTVAEAATDPRCREVVEAFWSEAIMHLPASVNSRRYCHQLWERFENPSIAHLLDQIAEDSSTKLRVRVAPVALAERRAGRSGIGSATVIGAWIGSLRAGLGRRDSQADAIDAALASTDPVAALVALISPVLSQDREFTDAVAHAAHH